MEGEKWKMGGGTTWERGNVSTQKERERGGTNHSNNIYKSYRDSYYLVLTYIYKYLNKIVPYKEMMPSLKS